MNLLDRWALSRRGLGGRHRRIGNQGYAFVVLLQSRGNLAMVDDVLSLRGVLSA